MLIYEETIVDEKQKYEKNLSPKKKKRKTINLSFFLLEHSKLVLVETRIAGKDHKQDWGFTDIYLMSNIFLQL